MTSDKPWYGHWPEGVPKSVDIPEKTLSEMLVEGGEGRREEDALFTADASYTYGDVLESVEATAGYLSQWIDSGDSVGIYMHNRPEFVFAMYGALRAGGVAVFIDPSTKGQDLEYELSAADVEVVFVDDDVANEDPGIYYENDVDVVSTGEAGTPFEAVLDAEPARRSRSPDDDALIFYYAGVAEKSQPVYHTHRSIVSSERVASTFKGVDENDVGITTAPMTHGLGLFSTMQSLHNGATAGLIPRFDVETAISFLTDRDVTYIEGGPPVFKQFVDHDDFSREITDSIEWCLAGGAPLPKDSHEAFVDTSDAPLLQLYGLTEAPNVAMTPINEPRYGSMGIPLPNTDVKVVDPDDWGEEVPLGEEGELHVDTPASMRAYESDADTDSIFDGEWMATGDIVVMDDDGFLQFRGTQKRVINYKGYPILPRDLEEILVGHDAVADCRVVPEDADDEDVGQIPVAKVISSTDVSESGLLDYVNDQVSAYKQIRRIDFVESLE